MKGCIGWISAIFVVALIICNLVGTMKNANVFYPLLYLYLLVIPLSVSGQISFEHIGLLQGLSQSTVVGITQDRKGNMWFATHDGLNRFDGYSFMVYQYDESDSTSISDDIIRTVMTDRGGNVWAGTHRGLSLYDMNKDAFRNFYYLPEGKETEVLHIEEWDSRFLLLNTSEGLSLFDKEKQCFQEVPSQLKGLRPTAIERDGEQLYLGVFRKLMVYSFSDHSLDEVEWLPSEGNGRILAIFRQAKDKLWIGTEGNGLFLLNPESREVAHYRAGDKGLSSDYIRVLALDSESQLWVGTINSLNIYNEKADWFQVYDSNPVREGTLSQASVRSVYRDAQGGMWLGTYFGGLNYYHPLKQRFQTIKHIPYHNSLSDNVVNCIREDTDGNLWIGTNSGGLNFYEKNRERYTCYSMAEGLEYNDVKSLYIDEKNNLVYVGVQAGGLNVLDRRSGRISRYTLSNSSLQARSVYAILPGGDGTLWLGISNGDVYRYFVSSGEFRHVPCRVGGKNYKSKGLTVMHLDVHGRLWIGGRDGLKVYVLRGNFLEETDVLRGKALPDDMVNAIYEDSEKGRFWIGTRNGLYRIDELEKSMEHYTTKDGLPNNVVQSVLEDASGMLWLSTDKGVSRLDMERRVFRNYSVVDGLSSNQFNSGACCFTSEGKMLFGSVDGITSFNPEALTENPYIPPTLITELQVSNKVVRPGDGTGVLKKHISETDRITLSAWQSSFMLRFAVTDYISGAHNRFAYRLDGYEDEWIYVENPDRFAVYSNLPSGEYRFMVKAANRDGLWNEMPTVLDIEILPVWYKTWWAILLFFLLASGSVAFVIRYFWIRKSMGMQLEMERLDKEKVKEVNEMKLRFFINISHELRTPLTLIVGPMQDVLSRVTDNWVLSRLKYVDSNAKRLLHLVNQLMDYRRAELGVFHLKVRDTDIHALVERVYLIYANLAESKGLVYSLDSEMEGETVLCDESYVELILNNLLSNAFKYTSKGSVTVRLKKEESNLLLQVEDTGPGIPPDKQKLVFERFYQVDHEHMGSGIGLSLIKRLVDLHHGSISLDSTVGKGSVFSVCLPLSSEVYGKDEFAKESDMYSVVPAVRSEEFLTDAADGEMLAEAGDSCAELSGKKDCVLLVEDNTDIMDYLEDGLRDFFDVLRAGNGQEALDVLQDKEVNLILTDVMMPVMDGIRLCRQVKRNLKTSHIPVIILSAKGKIEDQLDGLNVGADDYIPKPFVMGVVLAKIRNVLRTYRQAVEYYSKSLEVKPEKMAMNPLDEEFLAKAVKVVENSLDDVEFSADRFASEMNMSRSNLYLKMKAITGASTTDFIRKIRFSHACKLLEEGRYNIMEISEMVGFNTPSYFTTSFKKYMGCLPTEYVKKDEPR